MARTTTLKGNPLELEGPELKVGDKAPDAVIKKDLLHTMPLSELNGQVRVYSVVPSLDTPVCAMQTKKFYEAASGLQNVRFCTISADLPPAQARFCGAEGIKADNLAVFSDHLGGGFGKAYGTYIPSVGINCRAVFVVGPDDTLRYVEYVPEIADHPDYDAVLACARGL